MEIVASDILAFLDKNSIEHEVIGEIQDQYVIASIFNPVDNGFYFYSGPVFSFGVHKCLVLTNQIFDLPDSGIIRIKDDPQIVFYRILSSLFAWKSNGEIAQTAIIHPEAHIGKNVQIGHYAVIGKCEIGDDCIIGSHTVIHDNSLIMKRVLVETHSVIGTQGVAWIWNEDGSNRIIQPQLGGVIIDSDCFIGSSAVIVRGSLNENTIIGRGTVIAPGVRIGHGTRIGKYVHFANSVITGGNSVIGDYSFVGSSAVFRPKVKVSNHTIVGAGAVVIKNTSAEGLTLTGVPAKEQETKDNPSGMPKPKRNIS